MTGKTALLFVFLCCNFFCSLGQQDTLQVMDTIVTLEEVSLDASNIKLDRLANKTGWNAVEVADDGAANVADLLQKSSSVYVKSYGSGGLATVSFRGTGAGRSSTNWNGMPLLGSTLGLLDYSLLNVNLFETIDFNLGGDSGRYGSGSIGGNVNLNNENELYKTDAFKVQLKSILGSYGRIHQGLKLSLKKGKWWATTRVSYEKANQDFTYTIREDLPKKINTHAARKQLSVLQSLGYKVNTNNEIEVHFWGQDNLRQIPPTTVQTKSEAEVTDKTFRLQGIWKHKSKNNFNLKTTAATSYNQNGYSDLLNSVFGDNEFSQVYLKSEGARSFYNGLLNVGLSNRFTSALTNNYLEQKLQNQFAFFFDYSTAIENWDLYLSLRQEWLNETKNPISGKIAAQYKIEQTWVFKASANKHYRTPALNDLYWAPGGDPDLKAERGWSQELAVEYRKNKELKLGLNVYNNNIQDWIQWGLLENSTFFSALNLPRVWSRGIEGQINLTKGEGLKNVSLQMSYNYNLSTYQFDLRNPSITHGDQVFYTPTHQVVWNFELNRPRYSLSYAHRLQSGVTSFSDPLDGFHVGNLKIRYIFQRLNVFLEVNNLWNQSYRVIERRPMPGRNFSIGISYKFLKFFKTK